MTHSFGNSTVARVDVTAVPEIKEHEITPVDKALVLASDGVWKYLSNQEVANIIHPYYRQQDSEGAAEKLVQMSYKLWRREETSIDDITCIVVFLDVK